MSLLVFFYGEIDAEAFQMLERFMYVSLIRKISTPFIREVTRFLLTCSWKVSLEYPSHS